MSTTEDVIRLAIESGIYPVVADHYKAELARLISLAKAEALAEGWMPIESAPKDGSYILLWEEGSYSPFVGYWFNGSWSACHEHVDAEGGWDGAIVVDRIECPVTHWRPLPPPPSLKEKA